MRSISRLFPRVIAPVSTVLLSSLIVPGGHSADHQEAPATMAQLAADIGDYYIWHADDTLNMVLTFGTFSAPELPATFDRDIIYGFHFDTTTPADGESDIDIYARFSQSTEGEWGVQISGVGDSPLEGAVETVLSNSELSAWAGLSDDPFFFDQTGFNTTVSSGTLAFDPNRDDVAGLNVTAIAIQLPVSNIVSNSGSFQSWVTTSSL